METDDVRVELEWEGGQRFRAAAADHALTVDGEQAAGASPMQLMALAIGGCMGIDVAHILGRMRTPPQSLHVSVTGERTDEEPRRFRRIVLSFALSGDVPQDSLVRAIELSRSKYCSAWATVRPDVELVVETTISPPPAA